MIQPTDTPTVIVDYDRGTVLVRADTFTLETLPLPGVTVDPRVNRWRAPGRYYRDIICALRDSGVPFEDRARDYRVGENDQLSLALQIERSPFPYQQEAVDAWWKADGRGIVVLPTGSGKTFVAQLAMMRADRPTLIVAPTIDLMQQWYGVIGSNFGVEVGLLGGGYYEPLPITVATYDSAYLHMERLGNRYGLVIFDECHHLPGPSYILTAEFLIAPFRLGLTATLEREDGAEVRLENTVGPTVYRQEIKALAGEYLSDYETVRIHVRLSDEEAERYHSARTLIATFFAITAFFSVAPRVGRAS